MRYIYIIFLSIFLMPVFLFAQQVKLKALSETDTLLARKSKLEKDIYTAFFYKNNLEKSTSTSNEGEMMTDTFLVFPELFHPQLAISTDYSRAKKKRIRKEMVVNYFPGYAEVKYPYGATNNELFKDKIWKIKKDSTIMLRFTDEMKVDADLKNLEVELGYLKLDNGCHKLAWKNLSSRVFNLQNNGETYFLKITSHGHFGFRLDLYDHMSKVIETPFISTQNQSFQIREHDYTLMEVDLKLGEITMKKQLTKNIAPYLSRKALEEKINIALSKQNKELFVFDKSYILLHFWGPWCGPCVADIPKMEKMINELNLKEKINIVSVSAFTLKNDIEKFNKLIEEEKIDKQQIIEYVFSDKNDFGFSNLHKTYKVETYPSLKLIDENGNIVFEGVKFDESLASSLKKLLK